MYAPVVEALEGKGVKREDIALLFSFRVLSANEMLFDPNMGVIPYPNDVLLDFDSNSGKVKGVNLPVSEGDSDFMKYIKTELKKFDGFSTMPAISADFLKPLSPATLKFTPSLMEVGQFGIGIADITKVDPNDPGTLLNLVVMGADYFDSQMLGGKLLITTKPGKPLPPNGRFMIVLYDKLESADKGADGKPIPIHVSPVFFLARSKNPLVDENGKSNIKAVLSDSDAALLETLRLAYKPIFDVFEGFGIQRKRVLSFFTFTTMSTDAPLKEMYDQLQEAQHKPLISDGSLLAPDDDKVKGLFGGEPYDKISHVTPDGVLAGNILLEPNDLSDPLNPKLGKFPAKGENGYEFSMTNFEFIFFLPKGTPPYKVVIFQHEYMGEKEELYTIANDFAAKNLASIAIDMPYHGNHPHRIEGMPGGYGFLSPDIFADADNMRETALEHFQLVRLIKESLNTFIKVKLSIAEDRLNTDEIYYFGASMGGVTGTMTSAIEPAIKKTLLNVTGGHLMKIFTETPSEDLKKPLTDALAALGIKEGTAEYVQFVDVAQWILGLSDPVNFALPLKSSEKAVYLQMALHDPIIPNSATVEFHESLKGGSGLDLKFDTYGSEPKGLCHEFLVIGCDKEEYPDFEAAQAEALKDAIDFLSN